MQKKDQALEAQREQLDELFKDFDTPIVLPPRGPAPLDVHINPRAIGNTSSGPRIGSSSSEFHSYKAARRKEHHRLHLMELETEAEKQQMEFDKKRALAKQQEEERTAKNRLKRLKKRKRTGAQSTESLPEKDKDSLEPVASSNNPPHASPPQDSNTNA